MSIEFQGQQSSNQPDNRMNIGIDFHDTLSYAPEFFISIMKNWSHDIYVISGTPASQKADIKRQLDELGITPDLYKDILLGYEYGESEMGVDHFNRMRVHKLEILREYDITIFFDDNPFYVEYMKDYGITVFQTILSTAYLDKWSAKDPLFTCNLQRKQFGYLDELDRDNPLMDL